MIKKYFLSLFLGCIILWGAFAQSPEEQLQDIFTVNNLMGMSVVAVYQGEMIFNHHMGLSNFAADIPVTNRTMYRIASISKSITAAAFFKLYDQGLVGLDDDISTILGFTIENPNYSGIAITPRMLLSHTSTLNDGSTYGSFLGNTYNNSNPPSVQQLIVPGGNFYASNNWINATPGSYFRYSNLGYGVLASVIEKVSDTRFDIYVRENILEPLGIGGSFNIHDLSGPANLAVLYRMSCGLWDPQADNYPSGFPAPIDYSAYVPGHNGFIFGPQGGLRISAEDLATIMIMFMNDGEYKGIRILEEESVALMKAVQWQYNGSNGNNYSNLFNAWGLGFHISTNQEDGDIVIPEYNMTGHPGEAYGLISDMYFHNNPDFGIIFITNGSAGSWYYGWNSAFYEVEEQIFDVLYNNVVAPLIAEPHYHDIIIDVQGMGTTSPAPGTYTLEQGHDFTLTATPDDGWLFKHFIINGEILEVESLEIILEKNLDITAVFVHNTTGTGLLENKSPLKIWVRSSDNLLVIQADDGHVTNVELEVFSASGIMVSNSAKFNIESGEILHFDLSFLGTGMFIVKLRNDRDFLFVDKIFIRGKR